VSFELHAANKDPTRARCPLNLRFGSVNFEIFTGVRIETLVGVGALKMEDVKITDHAIIAEPDVKCL